MTLIVIPYVGILGVSIPMDYNIMSKVKLHEYQYNGIRIIKLNERMRKQLKFFNYTNSDQLNNKKKSNKFS